MKNAAFFLACLVVTLPLRAAVIPVDADGPGFRRIQDAIDAARNGDHVVLADGVYRGTGNRDIRFGGKAIVVRSKNGPAKCIIDCAGGRGTYHQAFLFDGGEGKASVIAGFTIKNGRGGVGGAVYCKGASPTISYCVFVNNTARHHGGAIYCDSSAARITACTFDGNTSVSGHGGAIFSVRSNLSLSKCKMVRNKAGGCGGAVFNNQSGGVLDACEFEGNAADELGGAVYGVHRSNPTVANCKFTDNQAASASKALYVDDELGLLVDEGKALQDTLSSFFAPVSDASRVFFVDGLCGNDSWTGRQRACAGPNGPKRTVQAAINTAASGDIVVVLPAIYFENITIENTDLIVAGIPGRTVIDGGGADRVVSILNSLTSIFGMTFQNGNAVVPIGGGILCENSTVVMVESIIRDNFAFESGGGIFSLGSDITLKSCDVLRNSTMGAPSAGGAGLHGGGIGSSLTDCLFERNEIISVGDGAGIRGFGGLIQDCVITDNHILFEAHLDGGGGLARCTGPIVGCTISNNSVEFGDGGGASECSGPITDCIIINNVAFSGIGDVVAVSGGGLARCSGPITNCIIAGNTAQNTDGVLPAVESRGGGLANCSGPIVNCTIANNRAVENMFGSCGGGLWNCSGPITNCIVWENTAIDDAQVCDSSVPNFCCIQDWPGGGIGNIVTDPMFVDLLADHRLRPGSPCIDAGDNDAVAAGIVTDLAGSARFFDDPGTVDTGNGIPPIVDMGAYEFSTVCGDAAHPYPPMDFNRDCIVDFADFALFLEHWLECTRP